jgi:hypothetical protein
MALQRWNDERGTHAQDCTLRRTRTGSDGGIKVKVEDVQAFHVPRPLEFGVLMNAGNFELQSDFEFRGRKVKGHRALR